MADVLALLLVAITLTKQPVSICQIMRRPAAYERRLVDIRADILLALPHGAVLLDKSCPNASIRLGVDLTSAQPSATNLVSNLTDNCSNQPRSDQVPGIFGGRLTYSSTGRLELRLFSVRDLHITPCPAPPGKYRIRHLPLQAPPPNFTNP